MHSKAAAHRYCERLSRDEGFVLLALQHGKTAAEWERLTELYGQIGDTRALEAATRNKVLPMVAHALLDSAAAVVGAKWRQEHDAAQERTGRFFEELEDIAEVLATRGVRVAVIENAGVAYSVRPGCWGCFASRDIEILVRRQDLAAVDCHLMQRGYDAKTRERCRSEDTGDRQFDRRGWAIYHREIGPGESFWLNVMWRPVIRHWMPVGRDVAVDELLDRAVAVDGRSRFLRVLSAEDQLLVCALHTASHSYVRGIGLRLQLDVDRIVRSLPIDWSLFVDRVRAHRVSVTVFPSLAIPKGLWEAPVPEEVLDRLVPSRRKQQRLLRWVARASLFQRDSPKFGRLEFLLFNAALCDSGPLAGLLRALFPAPRWMREVYGSTGWALPVDYSRRLASLALRCRP